MNEWMNESINESINQWINQSIIPSVRYQFYMLVTSEGAKIRKKKEEEERRKMMAEGLDKLQKALGEKVAAREAVQAINVETKAVSRIQKQEP